MSIQRVTNRDKLFKNCFKFDGVNVRPPNLWNVDAQLVCTDAKRLVKTAEVKINYIATILVIEWTYYDLSSEEFEALYDAYIVNKPEVVSESGKKQKTIFHTITTLSSTHANKIIDNYKIYTQNDFKAPPAHLRFVDGKMQYFYDEVKFTFTGVGNFDWDELKDAPIDKSALANI